MPHKDLLSKIRRVICNYLRIDHNLFFLPANCVRIQEAKRYFCYLAVTSKGIPPVLVAKYLGYNMGHGTEIVNKYNYRTKEALNEEVRQIEIDIENLTKLI